MDKDKKWWIDNAQKWYANEHLQAAPGDIFKSIKEIKDLRPKTILDLGCGSGRWSVLMPDNAKYLGVDISPLLIEVAKANNPGKEFKIMDAESIGKLKKKFDVIFSYGTLLGIPPQRIKKVAAAMKKAGKYAVIVEKTIWEPFTYGQAIDSSRYIHPYKSIFNVIKEIPLETTRSIFIIKL